MWEGERHKSFSREVSFKFFALASQHRRDNYLPFTLYEAREMENISRGPTFGDFVTIGSEASMQDVTVARLLITRVQTPLSPLF